MNRRGFFGSLLTLAAGAAAAACKPSPMIHGEPIRWPPGVVPPKLGRLENGQDGGKYAWFLMHYATGKSYPMPTSPPQSGPITVGRADYKAS